MQLKTSSGLSGIWHDFVSAVQFLTRIPVPVQPYDADSLARSVKFFPVVGAIVGSVSALVHLALAPHLPRSLAALITVLCSVLLTGGLHEDGLADAADGFGGGTSRDKVLLIMRDSRIGTYGGIALITSILGRTLLISSLPQPAVATTLIGAAVLARWTILPLSFFLPAARTQTAEQPAGQGARVAGATSKNTLIFGTLCSFAIAALLMHAATVAAILAAVLVSCLTGWYYRHRLAGVTGDCFGATVQISELCIYLCGVWIV